MPPKKPNLARVRQEDFDIDEDFFLVNLLVSCCCLNISCPFVSQDIHTVVICVKPTNLKDYTNMFSLNFPRLFHTQAGTSIDSFCNVCSNSLQAQVQR